MGADSELEQEKQENLRKWEISRRQMIKLMGGAAVATGGSSRAASCSER